MEIPDSIEDNLIFKLLQITLSKPGFLAGGRFWREARDDEVHGQFDDNELDVAYYSEVKNKFKLKVNLTSKMLTGLFFFSTRRCDDLLGLRLSGRGSSKGAWFSRTAPGAACHLPTPSTPSGWRSSRCQRKTGSWTSLVLSSFRTTNTGIWSGFRRVWLNKRLVKTIKN